MLYDYENWRGYEEQKLWERIEHSEEIQNKSKYHEIIGIDWNEIFLAIFLKKIEIEKKSNA